MSTKEQKIQGRKAELPALCFLNLSTHFYVWVTVWVRRLTHILTHTVSAEKVRKIPEIMRFRGFSGAAGRIRTADLILTNRNLKLFMIFSVSLCSFLFRFICFPALFKSVVSAYSTQVCGCLCGQKAFLPKTLGYRESLFLFTVHLCRRELALSFCE